MSRSHQYNTVDPVKAATAIVRGVAGTFIASDNARRQVIDHRVQRTGEAIAILGSYIAYRIDLMNDILKDEKVVPFVQKLRNRSNGITRACEEFAKTIEPYIEGEEKHKAYGYFSEIITQGLDSLFEDMHRDEPEATYNVRRRAKLRCHEPFPTDVKERTAAFEDGYCKGFMDAMGDFMKTVEELGETNEKLTVGIINDKITVKPLDQ